MPRQSDLHKGHRKRVRERFFAEGLNCFEDHTILELLLFYCLPRIDTNNLAHKLINHFGSLNKVFEADLDELCGFGLSNNTAAFIKYQYDLFKSLYMSKKKDDDCILTVNNIDSFFLDRYIQNGNEETCLLLLDAKCRNIYCETFKSGAISNDRDIKEIIKLALLKDASGIVIARNKPCGDPTPDDNDLFAAELLGISLHKSGIQLTDYLIIADYICFSLGNSKYKSLFI